ncbi:MAG: type II toxin-antitoxin system PemK/MazF family toxin, partial [Chloroflexi bacterium]|nr:type II toxin-antitoxin system PemK/MazF family toxin [Chloroflexota bacterium]
GEVWEVDFEPIQGSETGKLRPAVILSSDALARFPVRLVVPITEWQEKHARYFWRVRIDPDARNGLSKPSAVDVLQTRVAALGRFKTYRGALRADQLEEVTVALAAIIEHQ